MVTKSKGTAQILLLMAIGILISLGFASAITGRIGNGRMTLDAEVGDVISKSVLVINSNNVTVNITVSAAEGLEKDTTIIDKNFILQPGEQKKAAFTIRVRQPGTTTTRINIQFTPINVSINSSKAGIGLSSLVTINAYGKGELPQENNTDSGNNNSSAITGNTAGDSSSNKILILMGVMSLVLLIVLVLLLNYLSKKKSKKEEVSLSENKTNGINQEETDSKKKIKKEKVK